MIPISSLRARLAKLEARQPPATRSFIVVVGEPDFDRAVIAGLPGEVTVISSGVCRDPLDTGARQRVVYEQAADGRWLATDPQDLAA
jgi:hypothetical protein